MVLAPSVGVATAPLAALMGRLSGGPIDRVTTVVAVPGTSSITNNDSLVTEESIATLMHVVRSMYDTYEVHPALQASRLHNP
jgi:hypothetical protein